MFWGRQEPFDRVRFEADLARIVAFSADRGYPDARVTGFDVAEDPDENAVDITVTVDLGDPVLLGAYEFRGFDVVPREPFAEMQAQLPIEVGRPRDRRQVLAAHDLALNTLRDHGYPYARVSVDEEAGGTERQVSVTFSAEPGPLAHFGPVEIVGNETVSERVIGRALLYRPGDLYRRRAIQESQRRLYAMELFQFANIEMLDVQQQSPEVRTRVTIAEGDHQRVNFGVGYGTEEKARVDGEYQHVNFLGGARSAGLQGRWSSIDRGMRVNFTQPYLFSPRYSFYLEGRYWQTDAPAYISTIAGATATVRFRQSPQTAWLLSALSERNSSLVSEDVFDPALRDDLIALGLDPTTAKQEGTLSAVAAEVQRTTADSAMDATRGYQLAARAEHAGYVLPGTFHYFAISGDARHYLPIGQRVVAASRIQVATIDGFGVPGNVPFAKKYFLGGATSVRGWGRYEISPLSATGLPVGGNSLFAWSSELRARAFGNVGGVVFVDAGNVWTERWTIELDDLRYSVGAGVRYQTPVGPVRFDFGYQLNPIDGLVVEGEPQTRRYRLHFSIGHAF
jgi:outer membrane protein assembly complex protein YaeT